MDRERRNDCISSRFIFQKKKCLTLCTQKLTNSSIHTLHYLSNNQLTHSVRHLCCRSSVGVRGSIAEKRCFSMFSVKSRVIIIGIYPLQRTQSQPRDSISFPLFGCEMRWQLPPYPLKRLVQSWFLSANSAKQPRDRLGLSNFSVNVAYNSSYYISYILVGKSVYR